MLVDLVVQKKNHRIVLLKQLYFMMRKLYHNKVVTKNNSDGERKVWAGQVQGGHPVQDESRGVQWAHRCLRQGYTGAQEGEARRG